MVFGVAAMYRTLLRIALLCCLVTIVPPTNAQDIPGLEGEVPTAFEGCTETGYESALADAQGNGQSTADVHREWYNKCLITILYRGQYLDPWLEHAISGYRDWLASILVTGDEDLLEPELHAAKDYLGKGISHAVDRANDSCRDANDWRLAKKAVAWWEQAEPLGVAIPAYRLDRDGFLDRLCVKMAFEFTEGSYAVLGFDTYSMRYRVGIRIEGYPARFDVPVEEQLAVVGGVIVRHESLKDAMSSESKDASPQELADVESALAEADITPKELESYYAAIIQPENNDFGLRIELVGKMIDLPIVADKKSIRLRQNPYVGSTWSFAFIEDTKYPKHFCHGSLCELSGNNAGGSESTQAKGRFKVIWAPPSQNKGMILEFSGTSGRHQWLENPDEQCTGDQGAIDVVVSAEGEVKSGPIPVANWDVLGNDWLGIYARQASHPSSDPLIFMSLSTSTSVSRALANVSCFNGETTWTEQRLANAGTVAIDMLFLEAATFGRTLSNDTRTIKSSYELACVGSCPAPLPGEPEVDKEVEPPPQEPDRCSESWIIDVCDRAKHRAILFCSGLDDWQVSVDWKGWRGDELYCETLDCSASQHHSTRTTETQPYVTSIEESDAECSAGKRSSGVHLCTVTCTGFPAK